MERNIFYTKRNTLYTELQFNSTCFSHGLHIFNAVHIRAPPSLLKMRVCFLKLKPSLQQDMIIYFLRKTMHFVHSSHMLSTRNYVSYMKQCFLPGIMFLKHFLHGTETIPNFIHAF